MNRLSILAILLTLFVTNIFAQRPPTLTDDDIETSRTTKPIAEEKSKRVPLTKSKEASAWVRFSSAEGGFSVLMPTPPEKESRPLETPVGKLEAILFGATRNGCHYFVSFYDLPKVQTTFIEAGLDAQNDAMIAAMIQRGKGKLLSKTSISLGNYSGREFRIDEDKSIVTMRTYLVEKRVFQLMAFISKDQSNLTGASDFLDSFTLLK